MTGNRYHHEIDGLRAISVVVIILFHLKVSQFSGGFIGVDVFFVVSGFLISQIILGNLSGDSFTFRDFYLRRTTRILPALIVMVAAVLLVAALLQQPTSLVHTAWESIYALLSVSNLYFWSEANYWATSSENYVLLHTWSLGVEEQFYLIYPLLLVVAYRLGQQKGVLTLLVFMLVAGTWANEEVFKTDRTAAFYLSPLRFYEFALGGLGAVLFERFQALRKSAALSNVATVLGISMILWGAVTLHPFIHRLPGAISLIPAGGALLAILAGPSACARLLLCNPVMSWLGKTSYSLYLVHWPLIVFYRYYFGGHLDATDKLILLGATLLSAELLCRGVERTFRLRPGNNMTRGNLSARKVVTGILVSLLLLIAFAGTAVYKKGFPGRLTPEAQSLLDISAREDNIARKEYFEERCLPAGEVFCGKRDPERKNIMLIGDSRVPDMYIALETAYPQASVRASYAMGCPAVFDRKTSFSRFYPKCPQLNEQRMQAALDAPENDIIFITQALLSWRVEPTLETVRKLRGQGKTVYVLGQFIGLEGRTPVEILIDKIRFGRGDDYLEPHLEENPFRLDGEFADQVRATGAVYVSNVEFFRSGGMYRIEDEGSGRLVTYDGSHLNTFGAGLFGEFLGERYPLPGD